MVGVLRETHYDDVREQHESDQLSLQQFSSDDDPTTIAVVSLPQDTRIDEFCDEWKPVLGMPENDLKRFWSYKSGFNSNSAVDNPAERAYEEARLDYHYKRHIQTTDEAQKAINGIVSRLRDGEDITLVCFEDASEPCHRHVLKEMVEARLSSDIEFEEKDRAGPTA